MGQRTASLRVFSGFFERSHPTWHTHRATHRNQSDRILLGVRTACLSIHQDEFQYFNLSPVLQLSAQSGIIQRRWASGRDREHTIKDCYSKIDFEVIQIVCMCTGRFHYSSTILNQMSTQMLYTSLFSPLLNRNSHVFPHARTWHARTVLLIHLMHDSQFVSFSIVLVKRVNYLSNVGVKMWWEVVLLFFLGFFFFCNIWLSLQENSQSVHLLCFLSFYALIADGREWKQVICRRSLGNSRNAVVWLFTDPQNMTVFIWNLGDRAFGNTSQKL